VGEDSVHATRPRPLERQDHRAGCASCQRKCEKSGLVLQHIFKRFGIEKLLSEIALQHPQLQFNFVRIIFTMIVCRFLRPGSKLKIFEHWQDRLYPELLAGKDELHHLYRALNVLSAHKDQIEQGLYWHDRDLLNMSVDVVLYDLTTLRFESTREDLGELRRFGYSKEMRTDCTQVILGLLVDTEGIPLGFEVYPGNTFEGSTLIEIIKRMREKFKILKSVAIQEGTIDERPLTVVEVMKELSEVRAIPVKVKKSHVWVRTDIKGNAASLFKAIGIPFSPGVLKCAEEEWLSPAPA
jgi:hypothetical protein